LHGGTPLERTENSGLFMLFGTNDWILAVLPSTFKKSFVEGKIL
jgi:hypothetical protein